MNDPTDPDLDPPGGTTPMDVLVLAYAAVVVIVFLYEACQTVIESGL